MMATARQKMLAGDWYCCIDDELDDMRVTARDAVHDHNTLPPASRGAVGPKLRELFAEADDSLIIEAPFHCAYGCHIHFGANVYLNAGCTILDTAPVRIGSQTMLGPYVQIYCADHHHDTAKRSEGLERALPVTIGNRVWIGGSAVLLPGVTVGDGAIVGAGSVVTRDVAPGARVVGNPARPLPA